ncbi:MAG: endonuclease/exonuclease/phosphatase family protein [Planctomycetota bacterium]|jgi:endonuclease/exonuclease/phosphatase (EEP) superfamily protein YafD|nr:endonuclease/exonuclease/phosphatase family protein [Planctomycetota bacterium]
MEESAPHTPGRRPAGLFLIPTLGLVAVTAVSFAGRWHWLLDLASHFRWYWLVAAVAWLALAARRQGRLATSCLALVVIANGAALLPYWLPAAVIQAAASSEPLEIVSLNVLAGNPDKAPTLAYLRHRGADLVVLLEVDEAWAAALEELAPLYPHRLVELRDDKFGVAILSQFPLEDPQVETLAEGPPVMIVGVPRGQEGCLVVAAHPPAPVSAEWSSRRDAQLAAIGERAATESRPVIVAGDLNATPWSHGFRQLVGPRGLRDSALGRGLQPTWNARHWLPRIPIDHVVISDGVEVLSRGIGPDVGSDHLPVEATLLIP